MCSQTAHFRLRTCDIRLRIVKKFGVILALLFCVSLFFLSNANLRISRYMSIISNLPHLAGDKSPDRPDQVPNTHSTVSSIEADYNQIISEKESPKLGQGKDTDITDVKDKCMFPNPDPFAPSIIAVTKFNQPINCENGVPHLVYLSGYTIKVNHSRTGAIGNTFDNCRYKSVAREPGSDYTTVVLNISQSFNDEITPRDGDDNLIVECFDTNKTVISRSYFTLIRVKTDLELELKNNYNKHIALNSPKEVLNVLMFGLDGNSKQNLERHMPRTRNFLLNELKALELHKYNKVGDGTNPNIMPILTGRQCENLKRDNWTWHYHYDRVKEDFVWSDFRKVGYRTGVFFDDNFDTAFHYMNNKMLGWDKPPVDYYMRATILESNKDKFMKSQSVHCVGDIPEITSNYDSWIQMASTFNNSKTQPYFGFSFSGHLTHDDHNMASAGDHLYLQFFQELRDKNLINNTVIIFFSDHGERFGDVRHTYNGMLESNMPHIFLIFPSWFYQKYPELTKVLKINQERLTTNRDVYETLRDLVNFQATTGQGDLSKTGISLFYEIPRERTCEDADIPTEFCVCNQVKAGNVSNNMILHLADGIKYKVNSLLSAHQDKCAWITYKSTNSLMRIQSDALTKDEEKYDVTFYKMTITTNPGDAIFEGTVKYNNSTKKVEVIGDILRVNMYRGQDGCMDDVTLKPLCYCW